jgi:hypothetical protein
MKKIMVVVLFLLAAVSAMAESENVLTMSPASTALLTDVASVTWYRETENINGNKRYVQVFVVDPDPNVNLKESVLYKSEPFFTNETDMEIRHNLNLLTLLEKHNKKRVLMKDKQASLKYGRV